MRQVINNQSEFDFQPSSLEITNRHYAKYRGIDRILRENRKIVELVHKDLEKVLVAERTRSAKQGRRCSYSADTVLRIIICQVVEQESLRGIVVRVDDSNFLRRFVRVYNGPMMDFTSLDRFRNAIQPSTWKAINRLLAASAIQQKLVDGKELRLDTTAVETNVHWPTDSSLLWDVYRVESRLIELAREIDPEVAGDTRLQKKRAKRLHTWIARKAGKKTEDSSAVKERYEALIGLVEGILKKADEVRLVLKQGMYKNRFNLEGTGLAEAVIAEIDRYRELGRKVADQATRRVLRGETVPNDEKIYSLFEPHTELLIRGKAGKRIEFGHMVHLQQTRSKFITNFEVFLRRPVDHELVEPALAAHKKQFGHLPAELSADKGFYESMNGIIELEKTIDVVSIAKKGSRTEEEKARETTPAFRAAQRFRAGIEGTISYLKRTLGLFRCFNKGWEHFVSTVASTVFVHNLLVLARGFSTG